MKILESAPSRYDSGVHLLTFGGIDAAYDRLVSHVSRGQKVLDLGCGTGMLSLRAAQKGATVKAIDVNPQMLEIAARRARESGVLDKLKFCEMGAAELGGEEAESYDVVMSGLCFSELTADELLYSLKQIARILKPGGLLIAADVVVPRSLPKRFLHCLFAVPTIAVTYLITQTAITGVRDLPAKIENAGFEIESLRSTKMGTFVELVARKTEDRAK